MLGIYIGLVSIIVELLHVPAMNVKIYPKLSGISLPTGVFMYVLSNLLVIPLWQTICFIANVYGQNLSKKITSNYKIYYYTI